MVMTADSYRLIHLFSVRKQAMPSFDFQQVDVFTLEPLRGNPLAVVVGADSLTDVQMAAFANWTNLSETTFLLRPTSDAADYRVRIFTPQRELPFAGYPTLGACHVWLGNGAAPKAGDVVQECGIGLVRVRRSNGLLYFAAPPLRRGGELEADLLARVLEGLHLTQADVIAASWVDNGPGWMAILVRSKDVVMSIKPDFAALAGLRVGVVGPWDPERHGTDAQFEVRAFTAGGFEDPVTGSLNAGLAQWLIGSGMAPMRYVASQGSALGRMGRVHIEKSGADIWVGGGITTCISGTLTL
jgi:PhzF family phenazine biosynthesis protein